MTWQLEILLRWSTRQSGGGKASPCEFFGFLFFVFRIVDGCRIVGRSRVEGSRKEAVAGQGLARDAYRIQQRAGGGRSVGYTKAEEGSRKDRGVEKLNHNEISLTRDGSRVNARKCKGY